MHKSPLRGGRGGVGRRRRGAVRPVRQAGRCGGGRTATHTLRLTHNLDAGGCENGHPSSRAAEGLKEGGSAQGWPSQSIPCLLHGTAKPSSACVVRCVVRGARLEHFKYKHTSYVAPMPALTRNPHRHKHAPANAHNYLHPFFTTPISFQTSYSK